MGLWDEDGEYYVYTPGTPNEASLPAADVPIHRRVHRVVWAEWLRARADMGPPNLLVISESDSSFFQQVCYDDTWVYYLRRTANGTDLCRTAPGQAATVLRTFSMPVIDIACWGDTLLIYGQLTNERLKEPKLSDRAYWDSKHGVYLLSKENPAAEPSVLTGTGMWANMNLQNISASMVRIKLPLRAAFNESTAGEPLDALWGTLYPQWIVGSFSKANYETLMHALGRRLKVEYHFQDQTQSALDVYDDRTAYFFTHDDSYLSDQFFSNFGVWQEGIAAPEIIFLNKFVTYQGYPYRIEQSVTPCLESGKAELKFDFDSGYSVLKWFSGAQGRMQYVVSSAYAGSHQPSYVTEDHFDVQAITSNQIAAVDLETMQQTRTLTLPTPHEQVLYVSAAGAYTWRHDEGRVFLTDWEGQSKPVSDIIPFTPRYETKQDEADGNTCNVWYVEFDAARSRLLLFGMTQGDTALLAVVPVV